jgi:signal transduction histidine kinase
MDGASRGAALTQKLLAFGRRQPLAPMRLNANLLIDSMGDLVRRAVGEQVTVDLKLDQGLWPIEVDPNQLENVLLNLAVNARDAMPNGGRLTIQSRNCTDPALEDGEMLKGQFTLLTVSDDGTGMIPEVLSHVFEPFFTTKGAGEGTGLGLSQVYGFVKQSNGHVDIQSAPGRGTTIRIYLPRAQAQTRADAERNEAASSLGPLSATPIGQAG